MPPIDYKALNALYNSEGRSSGAAFEALLKTLRDGIINKVMAEGKDFELMPNNVFNRFMNDDKIRTQMVDRILMDERHKNANRE
jgi:hypothetical protein